MTKDIHYEYWLLMIPYYCDKWENGVDYDELMKEYKLNQKQRWVIQNAQEKKYNKQ